MFKVMLGKYELEFITTMTQSWKDNNFSAVAFLYPNGRDKAAITKADIETIMSTDPMIYFVSGENTIPIMPIDSIKINEPCECGCHDRSVESILGTVVVKGKAS